MVVLHTVIAIALVIALIIKAKVDPVIALLISSLYLGLASGIGFEETVKAITGGFGEIMAEVGLLIGFGVLMHETGAFRKLVQALVRRVGAKRMPYAMAASLSTVFPSIYVDVQVVLASPVARSTAKFIGGRGLPWMAAALVSGIFCGYVFVVPGLSAVSISGLLGVPLGTWLLFGIVIGPVTALLTTLVFKALLRTRYWKPDTDEEPDEAMIELEAALEKEPPAGGPSLFVSLLPILVPLVMIAFGAFAELFKASTPLIAFLGDANIALFVGLVGAYLLARRVLGGDATAEAMSDGFHTTGEILLITGIGG